MTTRLYRIFFAFLLAALLMSACSGGGDTTASKEPLRVEFTQWWPDYTMVVAKEKGFFDKYGVNVEPIFYANFPQTLTDLPAHKIDGGLLAIGDALVNSQSASLKVVAVYDDGGYNTVVARPEITSVADLKGKKVGVLIGTSYELFVRYMLEKNGLNPTDVTLVNLDPTALKAELDSGNVDAGYTWDPSLTEGYQIIFQKQDAPGLFPDVIVFREDVVKERPDDIRAFLQAWFEAVEYRQQNPEETRQLVAEYTGLPLDQIFIDDQIHIFNLEDNEAVFQTEASGDSLTLWQAAQINADFQAQAGFMTTMPDFTLFLDSSFLK
ncbi:MAG: ABC transporter substrate-binding protein [Chloroflexi bacterium]|nr:ABC transporter substrate-binding protein [Chloroflexota bacterium]MBI3169726.1 ABC transporter substrate-binding protein [Chloroflexota bacterium]